MFFNYTKLAIYCLLILPFSLLAQDFVSQKNIKTVQFYNTKAEQSLPILLLNNVTDSLILKFDDLSFKRKDYCYTIQHCDVDWTPSNISPIDYIDGSLEDKIQVYQQSFNTYVPYFHYELAFPNDFVKPKISGNYLLKIYERNTPNNPIIVKTFYVLDACSMVDMKILGSDILDLRDSCQKIELKTKLVGCAVNNSFTDVKAVVMQNQRFDKQKSLEPLYENDGMLYFSNTSVPVFSGGNEFRRLDTRNMKYTPKKFLDSTYIFRQEMDVAKLITVYESKMDLDGKFFVRRLDGRDPNTQCDYVQVFFSLTSFPLNDDYAIYVIGKFNDWKIDDEYKMQYNERKGVFETSFYLKQGVYDYHYVVANPITKAVVSDNILDGTFFATQNFYDAFIYAKKQNTYYTSLVGYVYKNMGNSTTYLK